MRTKHLMSANMRLSCTAKLQRSFPAIATLAVGMSEAKTPEGPRRTATSTISTLVALSRSR